ncbi:MAG: T9SS type A sorting domain-containing protein [Bacteroidales bacterium]|nr:T9SS type A sorting domain-containing protein [Bacteroidales bacterium]
MLKTTNIKNILKKKRIIKFLFVYILFFINNSISFAQEQLVGLEVNPLIINNINKTSEKQNKDAIIVELPFFDDFSTSDLYPNTDLWTDSFAFINSSYPYQPPSIGVATFDAISNTGEFYEAANYGNSFIADYLSSQTINLDYPGDNTIYLSFYYQPQGFGDEPEEKDSLYLEFYAPDEATWNTIWQMKGSENSDFKQVIIHISDEKYLKYNFKFRFKNKVSLSTNSIPSKVGNVDHWHIDYVYLNRGRNSSDLVHHDVAFTEPMSSFLKDYEQMPWSHYLVNPANEISSNINIYYKNNDNVTRLIDSLYFVFTDEMATKDNDPLFAGSYNLSASELKHFYAPPNYVFSSSSTDSARFKIKSVLVTDGFDYKNNNEITFYQKFYNYYSYDDGTAEMGYGITGEGTENAKLASRFNIRKRDTLVAVDMYFNRTLFDNSQKYFYLTVWKDNGNGEPGEIIYQKEGYRPEYEDELNKFHTFHITDTTLIVEGDIYVGWTQTTTDMLNIGFDINRFHNENTFYNISGTWKESLFPGSLMIRPVLGHKLSTGIEKIKAITADVNIYPNPANEILFINIKNQNYFEKNTINIYSLNGKLMQQDIIENNTSINIRNLEKGIYIIKIINEKQQLIVTKKLIKL